MVRAQYQNDLDLEIVLDRGWLMLSRLARPGWLECVVPPVQHLLLSGGKETRLVVKSVSISSIAVGIKAGSLINRSIDSR